MAPPALPEALRLESLEVGAAPLVRLFLDRLDLVLDAHLDLFLTLAEDQTGFTPL